MKAQFAYIALGGNLGDVAAALCSARSRIAALPATELLHSSRLYRTAPIGPAGQPDYLNAVVMVKSGLPALQLLDALQEIESAHGRIRGERWGARTLDLDIIAIDQLLLDSARLTLPHPHMHERQFVLRPLCDVQPQWHHPRLQRHAAQLLQALLDSGEKAFAKGELW